MKRMALVWLVLMAGNVLGKDFGFPDGEWNNRAWELSRLMEGVERGDPDALAEWAFCAANVGKRLEFDAELVHARSKVAAEAGSAIGKLQHAICVERGIGTASDVELSSKLLQEAVETGHPCALAEVALRKIEAHDRQRSFLGFEPDRETGVRYLEQAVSSGFFESKHLKGRDLQDGYSGTKNFRKAARLAKDSFLETGSLKSAAWMYKSARLLSFSEIQEFLEEEVVEKAGERLRSAAALGNPYATYVLAWEGVTEERPHEAIPAFIQSINNKEPQAFWTATYFMRYGRYNRHVGSTVCTGNYGSIYKTAKEAYLRNIHAEDNRSIVYHYAIGLINKGTPEEKLEAADAFRALIRDHREYPYSYTGLAYYYLKSSEEDQPNAEEHFRRCVALGTFRSDSPNGSLALAAYLGEWSLEKFRDYPRAYAAAVWAEKLNEDPGCRQHSNKIAREAWAAMDGGERLKAQRLIEEEYPYKRSYREEAFEYLQEIGDMAKFLPFYEYSGEEDDEDPHLGFFAPGAEGADDIVPDRVMAKVGPGRWLRFGHVSADLPEESISESQRKSVEQLLEGGFLNDFYKEVFTKMAFRNAPRLRSVLERVRDESTKDKVDSLLGALDGEPGIDKGENPLGAGFGWYLVYEKTGMLAMPLVNRLLENGIAEEAGMRRGDVVESVNGVRVRSPNARNEFVRFLDLWPEGETMELVIGRDKRGNTDLRTPVWKGERKEISVRF
ncbi:MAG: PDZ domain-containing protein [Verrucomicrobiota bacterium]